MKTKKTKATKQVVFSVVDSEPSQLTLEDLGHGEAAICGDGEFWIRTDEGYFNVHSGLHHKEDGAGEDIRDYVVKRFIGRLKFSVVE